MHRGHKKRKGQLAFFLIIAITILFFGFFVIIDPPFKKEISSISQISFSAQRMRDFINTALDEAIVSATKRYGLSEDTFISFKSYVQIQVYSKTMPYFAQLRNEGFSVEYESPMVTGQISDEVVTIELIYPILATKPDSRFSFDSTSRRLPRTARVVIPGGVADDDIILPSPDLGAVVTIPKGTEITLDGEPVEEVSIHLEDRNMGGLDNHNVVGEIIYRLGPDDMEFSMPVKLEFNYETDSVQNSEEAENARIAWLNPKTNVWYRRPTIVECEDDECQAHTLIEHASVWAVLVGDCAGGFQPEDFLSPRGPMIFSEFVDSKGFTYPKILEMYGLAGYFHYIRDSSGGSAFYYGHDFIDNDLLGDVNKLVRLTNHETDFPWTCNVFISPNNNVFTEHTIMERLKCLTSGKVVPESERVQNVNNNPLYAEEDGERISEEGYKYDTIHRAFPTVLLDPTVGFIKDCSKDPLTGDPAIFIKYYSVRDNPRMTCCCKDTLSLNDKFCQARRYGEDEAPEDACDDSEDNPDGYIMHTDSRSWMMSHDECRGAWSDKLFYPQQSPDFYSCFTDFGLRACVDRMGFVEDTVKGYTAWPCAGGYIEESEDEPIAKYVIINNGDACIDDNIAQLLGLDRDEEMWLEFEPAIDDRTLSIVNAGGDVLTKLNLEGEIVGCSECSIKDKDEDCVTPLKCTSKEHLVEVMQDEEPEAGLNSSHRLEAHLTRLEVEQAKDRDYMNWYPGGWQDLLAAIEDYSFTLNKNSDISFRICFAPGTLIKTSTGNNPIEQVEEGDLVLSYNTKTKRLEYKPVLETYVRHTDILFEIKTEQGIVFQVTPDHPFFDGKDYRPISDFSVGDKIYTDDLNAVKILEINQLHVDDFDVYNLKVADNFNYFANRILSHNLGYGIDGYLVPCCISTEILGKDTDREYEMVYASSPDYCTEQGGYLDMDSCQTDFYSSLIGCDDENIPIAYICPPWDQGCLVTSTRLSTHESYIEIQSLYDEIFSKCPECWSREAIVELSKACVLLDVPGFENEEITTQELLNCQKLFLRGHTFQVQEIYAYPSNPDEFLDDLLKIDPRTAGDGVRQQMVKDFFVFGTCILSPDELARLEPIIKRRTAMIQTLLGSIAEIINRDIGVIEYALSHGDRPPLDRFVAVATGFFDLISMGGFVHGVDLSIEMRQNCIEHPNDLCQGTVTAFLANSFFISFDLVDAGFLGFRLATSITRGIGRVTGTLFHEIYAPLHNLLDPMTGLLDMQIGMRMYLDNILSAANDAPVIRNILKNDAVAQTLERLRVRIVKFDDGSIGWVGANADGISSTPDVRVHSGANAIEDLRSAWQHWSQQNKIRYLMLHTSDPVDGLYRIRDILEHIDLDLLNDAFSHFKISVFQDGDTFVLKKLADDFTFPEFLDFNGMGFADFDLDELLELSSIRASDDIYAVIPNANLETLQKHSDLLSFNFGGQADWNNYYLIIDTRVDAALKEFIEETSETISLMPPGGQQLNEIKNTVRHQFPEQGIDMRQRLIDYVEQNGDTLRLGDMLSCNTGVCLEQSATAYVLARWHGYDASLLLVKTGINTKPLVKSNHAVAMITDHAGRTWVLDPRQNFLHIWSEEALDEWYDGFKVWKVVQEYEPS